MVESVMIMIIRSALSILGFVVVSYIWLPQVKRFLDLREKDQKLHKYELFNNVNIDTVNSILDDYVRNYVKRYILYKFIANKIIYITQEDTNNMIKDVTTNIALDISDLYLYYISLVQAYDNDEELLMFVKTRVTNITIEEVTNYNATNVPAT